MKFAEDNSDHMKNLYDLCENAGVSCQQYQVLAQDGIGMKIENMISFTPTVCVML